MKLLVHLIFFLLFLTFSCSRSEFTVDRETNFNNHWKFIRADIEGAENPEFDDSTWRTLDLPHDYSIEDLPEKTGNKQIGPFSDESAGGAATGHVVGGTAWYRKYFKTEEKWEGKQIQLLFDGIYMDADIWLNGKHLGNHPYGYTAFALDLTPWLNLPGKDNVIAVQVKNEGENSRWYSGSGIYRNVKLLVTNPVHFALWGNFIATPKVSDNEAFVKIETEVVNSSADKQDVVVEVKIYNPEKTLIASETGNVEIEKNTDKLHLTELEIPSPQKWSPHHPALYTAEVSLLVNGKVSDKVFEKFGVRTIHFSPEEGFLLNGENVLLKGGCVHHDNGLLGAAAFKTTEYRKVKIMKENGFNAIRIVHNPSSTAFLEACDELGILVIDEAFDQWQRPKKPQDYNLYFDEWWQEDLESMVLRDRNHPSVIIWSIGNEINERADSSGVVIARNLRGKILSIDNTRPVTQAVCHFWDHPGREWEETAPAFAQMDVHGYNYRWSKYESDHLKYPERIMIGTESFPMEAFESWQMVEEHSYVIGDFVWTGMDYLGESGIGHTKTDTSTIGFLPPWPWFNAYCGDISILGYKKPQSWYRDVVWRNSDLEMMVHAPMPEGLKEVVSRWGWPEEWKNWNWKGNEGKPLQVSVYTRCDSVRLELNGKTIGIQPVSADTKLSARFEVPYEPGELVAVGLKNGKETARQSLKTSGMPFAVKITDEKIKETGNDLIYFNVEIVDKNGNLVPDAELPISFTIEGGGKLQAVGNGNPRDMKSFQQPRVNTFRGKCQLIVRKGKDGKKITVSAKSEGLKTGILKTN
ncbi:MAG: glycoside hydrolase family 2 [Draconibacterium sp.]|nr:MAG: glycoside hydrolase family 2 [Draconibacterium sp.]